MSGKEIDLVNRDPNELNNYIQVEFDDVLAEPSGAHSADCIWKNSYSCFQCGKNCGYMIMTYCCGLCIALSWGCTVAGIAFCSIWFTTPILRFLSIILAPVRKIISIYLSTCVGPCMETYGLIFSRIHVVNSQGDPPLPLGQLGDGPKGSNVKNF